MSKPQYGHAHRQERKRWAAIVEAGNAYCWRCQKWLPPGQPWDLGHVDGTDRYAGPECRPCNRGTAAVRGNRARKVTQPQRPSRWAL